MTPATRLFLALPLLAQVACLDTTAVVERRLERSFTVASGSTVRVDLSGGSVTAVTGPPGAVHILLRQAIHTNDGEDAAERLLEDFQIGATQDGDEVRVVGRRRSMMSLASWGPDRVRMSATVTVPADVRLDVGTRGGSIGIRGERVAHVRADTSGGSITADGGSADLILTTSGGSIKIGRALGRLSADTSGGSISVTYVGPTARDIDLSTSGGSIRVGVDPAAGLTLSAGTSGGSVRIEGLSFDGHSQGRSHANGTLNGGGGRLSASTSGGGVTVRAAIDPGARRIDRAGPLERSARR